MIDLCNGILHDKNFKITIRAQKDMGESEMHVAKWTRQSEKNIYCMILIIWHFGKVNTIVMVNTMVASSGRWVGWVNKVQGLFLGQWNYYLWYWNDEYKTLNIYQTSQNFIAQRVV